MAETNHFNHAAQVVSDAGIINGLEQIEWKGSPSSKSRTKCQVFSTPITDSFYQSFPDVGIMSPGEKSIEKREVPN